MPSQCWIGVCVSLSLDGMPSEECVCARLAPRQVRVIERVGQILRESLGFGRSPRMGTREDETCGADARLAVSRCSPMWRRGGVAKAVWMVLLYM